MHKYKCILKIDSPSVRHLLINWDESEMKQKLK